MKKLKWIKLREHPGYLSDAADWFHEKWGVPAEAYRESMEKCIRKEAPVPQWYIVLDQEKIIAGLGVIDNDFHIRKDLTPNVCAVYVEEACRCQGIAGKMLDLVCKDMKEKGIDTLYLVTDHISFYERYGWKFFCMVQEEDSDALIRMYIHEEPEKTQ